jgi:hemerythrin superfamily protein
MQIYEALKKDHVKVLGILNQLIDSKHSDEKIWKDLVQELRDELIPHARAEEAVFYNSLREIDASKKLAVEAYGEHMMAENLLRTLQATSFVNLEWQGVAKKLRDALKHHIADEEGKMFQAAKALFLEQETEMMGLAFEKMKPEIRGENIMQTTLDMVANMMPDRLRSGFKKLTPGVRAQP